MKKYKVNAQGSLGILALGDLGLKLWREAKAQEKSPAKDSTASKKKSNGKKADQ